MMGIKHRDAKLFYNIRLEDIVPGDHILRRLSNRVDFSFIRPLTKSYYSHTGQPSIDPIVLFKMMLIGYLFNISSERKLAKEIRVNLAYRLFLGYDLDEVTPTHSVLSKARRRFELGIFSNFFNKVVELCKEAGLISGEDTYVDSTLIQANASLKSFVQVKQAPSEYIQEVERYCQKEEAIDKSATAGKHFDGNVDEQKIGKRRQRSHINNNFQSKTDKDASVIYREGMGRKAVYKGHLIVDGKARVIVAAEATKAKDSDTAALPALTKQMEQNDVKGEYIAGDNHYGTIEAYQYLQGKDMKTVFKPLKSKHRPGFLNEEDFTYDKEGDQYICPQGKVLKFKTHQHTVFRKAYKAQKEDCIKCPIKHKCVSSKTQARLVTRFYGDWIDKAKEWVQSTYGKALLRKRKFCIEGIFGEGKTQHLLGRMLFRGLRNAKIQLFMTTSAMNLKRLIDETNVRSSEFISSLIKWVNFRLFLAFSRIY